MVLHRTDLPPLELLRSFEAAARTLSFTRAAGELFLTQSAVSRQIAALESHLGVALFERRHRALALTEAGQSLYHTTMDVLVRLRDTVHRLRPVGRRRSLTVTTTVGFASLWLVPRLPRFTAAHPEVDVRIAAANRIMDIEREDIDVAVRFTPRDRALGEPLFGEEVQPVCAPALVRDPARPLREPADLARHVLLVTMEPGVAAAAAEWPVWLEAVGLPHLEAAATLHFSQYDLLVAAAIAGQGVALGRLPLVREAIREGRLVAPFGRAAVSPRGYYLAESRRARGDPTAQAFVAWLRDEAACDAATGRSIGGGSKSGIKDEIKDEISDRTPGTESRPRSPRSTSRARRAAR
jgi:LysR family glycine cleavage system transcriptional activator